VGPPSAPRHAGRRRFLLGAGGLAAAFTLAACSSEAKNTAAGTKDAGSTPSPSASTYTGDLKVVALAVALENQAVGVYGGALTAAKAGKFRQVPPAVTAFMTTARAQHIDHAKVWNAVLSGAGKPAITNVPLSNQSEVSSELGQATDIGAVAQLALKLEDQAAETYLFATYNVTSHAGIETAATIGPVEAMHASILNFVLGKYPVPNDFLPTDNAASPTLLTV
jgi:hypothetical protein